VREILKTQYKNTASGHCGNEDCGQMSSGMYLVLCFYPNAAQGIYALAQLCLNRQLLI
jgi:putative alpha-1,2-mannosidase